MNQHARDMKSMRNKTINFLMSSLILVLLLCVLIFVSLGTMTARESADAIEEIGSFYMAGMSQKITSHFSTIVELRLSQIRALVETVPPREDGMEQMREDLEFHARARNFDQLAFYGEDGSFEMIYGDELRVIDPEPFLASLGQGKEKVAVGLNVQDGKMVLLGIPSRYPMRNGSESIALVAALPVEYLSDTLDLGESSKDAMEYSHIIRKDGSFIIRGAGLHRENYFERLWEQYGEEDKEVLETYFAGLQQALDEGVDYSDTFTLGGYRQQIYGTTLPFSEWYLVTVMPYGKLDEVINGIGARRMVMMIGSCLGILVILLFVFFKYFRITRQQMRDLDHARQEAVRATRAKSEFLSNMSHDIRTPMNAIVGMTAIATANIENQEQVKHCLRKISLSSKHLLGLINDILDMSKIESGKMTLNVDQLSLREALEGIVSITQPQVRAKKQKFEVLIHDIITENVCCDSVRLNQVLLNFLSNAVKFTPEEGSIDVALYQEESPRGAAYVRTHITIRDTGIGMSQEFIDKIYESYVREDNARVQKTEGAGLGMAITKYIVDAMGGTIEINSKKGEGTEFHVTLDMEKATVQEADMVLPQWNMLVVDDDETLCQTAVSSLKEIGLTADWTLSGESALEMVKKRHSRGDDYQIILLDWKLPGMDGIETARAIRSEIGEDVSLLLISAYDGGEIEEKARAAGISGFISKPLFKSTLFYGLKKFMCTEEQQGEEIKEFDFQGRHILMAEDNDLNWEIANELLSELGLQLDWAENGQICVEMFNQSEEGYYSAILMDLRMPVMTGYEAARKIRGSGRGDANIPIIAMTADAFAEDIKKCLDVGMNAHVAKPIDVKMVARLLEQYMGGH